MNATSHPLLTRQKAPWLVLAILTVLAVALRTISLFASMDPIGYFQKGSVPVVLFYVVIALAALVCVALFFLIIKEDTVREPPTLFSIRFIGAAIAAITFAVTAIFLILRATALPTPTPLNFMTAASLLCGAVYFASRLTAAKPQTTVLWGYGTILSTALSLILTYFDRYTQMNAPHKLSFHVCMLLSMLALLLEQRDLLERPLPRLCVVFTCFAAIFCTATALPSILAFAGGVFDDPIYLFFDIMTLGLAAYFVTKCASYALSPIPHREVSK